MHLIGSHIDVLFVYISGHAKVGDLAHFFITHQYVPSGQIAMDDLNYKPKTLTSQHIFNKISHVIVSLRKNTTTELTKKLSVLYLGLWGRIRNEGFLFFY